MIQRIGNLFDPFNRWVKLRLQHLIVISVNGLILCPRIVIPILHYADSVTNQQIRGIIIKKQLRWLFP